MISKIQHQFSPLNLRVQELQTLHLQALSYLTMFNSQQTLQDSINFLNAKIQIGKQWIQSQINPSRKGRGGNNIAQNMKKSVLSLLKRKLPTNVYDQFQERFIKVYKIKSQKQNLLLIFLFLEILHHQEKISRQQIVELIKEIKLKIEKYIFNSIARMQQEEQRREFHMKNIAEFRKFQKIDLDFSQKRSYQELKSQLDSFYLRKKHEFMKAQIKMRRIIQSATCLRRIFQIQDFTNSNNESQKMLSFHENYKIVEEKQDSSYQQSPND